jgi:hypothetical protein
MISEKLAQEMESRINGLEPAMDRIAEMVIENPWVKQLIKRVDVDQLQEELTEKLVIAFMTSFISTVEEIDKAGELPGAYDLGKMVGCMASHLHSVIIDEIEKFVPEYKIFDFRDCIDAYMYGYHQTAP